jgi:uncharacterized SAM-binding protein YcdF (DUF218 family)
MAAFELCKRRQIWLPTWRGWAAIAVLLVLLAVGMMVYTVPFLAPVRPQNSGILVVEGWLPDYALAQAKKTFEAQRYQKLVVTGVPIDQGFYLSKAKNYAQLAAGTLEALGIKSESIVPISCPEVRRDRTYGTACQVKNWLAKQPPVAVDIFTLGVHARRTWLLYRLALGKDQPIGIIAAEDERYDQHKWWTTSSGVRTVTSEVIAYLYAKLFFYPGPSGRTQEE